MMQIRIFISLYASFQCHIILQKFSKQVIAIYYNIVIGAFQWKNRYIYFTNNIDVSKKTFRE